MHTLRFNQVLRLAAEATQDPRLPQQWPVLLVRDIYGRVRFAVDAYRPASGEGYDERDEASIPADQIYPAEAYQLLLDATKRLGPCATAQRVLFRDDFFNPGALFNNPGWHMTIVSAGFDANDKAKPNWTIKVLDRQITGQDWLIPTESTEPHPHRIVFYGLKGGMGCSSALAMTAYGLAREGKRVLLLDFDLESPGLSGLLLPPDRVAEFGIVDWFVEDAVGQGDSVLRDIVADSPLADTTTGDIRVVAAMGNGETAYLSKLARIYADLPALPGCQGPRRFASRMQDIVRRLEAQEQPDVVLIDSRAGLHDIAAVAITSLADTALLFATDSAQNWHGYEQLFFHWQQHPSVCQRVRERLTIVQALTPKSNREGRSKAFLEHAYELFSSTLYDKITPPPIPTTQFSMATIDLYHPEMEDEAAPHFPIRVDWDDMFQEFDPKLRPEQGGVSDAEIDAKFGALISWVKARVMEKAE